MSNVEERKLTPQQMALVSALKTKVLQALGGPYEVEKDPLASLLAVLDAAAAIATYPWEGTSGLPMSEELFTDNARAAHHARCHPAPERQS